MRAALTGAVAALALSAAACSPPDAPLDVGVREYQRDVALAAADGRPDRDAVATARALFAGVPPADADEDGATPTPSPCDEPAGAAEAGEVPGTVAHPPAVATYTYQPPPRADHDPAGVARHTVGGIEDTAAGFAFHVAIERSATVTRTRYERRDDGLYLTHTETAADDERAAFNPLPALKLLALPAEPGQRWQARATDPHTGRTVAFTGEITEAVAVEVCGATVDGWAVQLSEGAVGHAPAEDEPESGGGEPEATFEGRLVVASGHGGLIVRTELAVRPADGEPITIDTAVTGEPEPAVPAGTSPSREEPS